MSTEKRARAGSDDFRSTQMVVKRPNLGGESKAVARVNGSAANGALVQAVCTIESYASAGC
jgi:Prp8 binding protein